MRVERRICNAFGVSLNKIKKKKTVCHIKKRTLNSVHSLVRSLKSSQKIYLQLNEINKNSFLLFAVDRTFPRREGERQRKKERRICQMAIQNAKYDTRTHCQRQVSVLLYSSSLCLILFGIFHLFFFFFSICSACFRWLFVCRLKAHSNRYFQVNRFVERNENIVNWEPVIAPIYHQLWTTLWSRLNFAPIPQCIIPSGILYRPHSPSPPPLPPFATTPTIFMPLNW